MSNNAYPSLYKWATLETNYPAGAFPWSSLLVKVAPSSDFWTPNQKPPAENENYVLNQLSAGNDQAVLDATALVAISNWNPPVAVTDTVDCATWDGVNGFFCTVVRNSTAHTATVACGRGTWPTVSSVTRVTGILKDPSDAKTVYLSLISTSNHAQLYRIDSSAGTATLIIDDPSRTFTDVKMAYLNGHLVYAACEASSTVAYIVGDNANQGASFGTTRLFNATSLLMQSNGTTIVCVGGLSTTPNLVTSIDGVNFTVQPTGFSGQIPSSVATMTGLAWGSDSVGGAWFLQHVRSDTNKTRWLRSSDGVVWTTTAASPSSVNWGFQTNCFVAIGSLLVAMATDTNTLTRILYSGDGATSWQVAPVNFAFSATHCLAASPTQFVMGIAGNLFLSFSQGVSLIQAT